MMLKTTVDLPVELKSELKRVADATGWPEAELIRLGIRLVLERYRVSPTIPIMVSDDPDFAKRVDEHLSGFGQR
jgi:hypothetical protein